MVRGMEVECIPVCSEWEWDCIPTLQTRNGNGNAFRLWQPGMGMGMHSENSRNGPISDWVIPLRGPSCEHTVGFGEYKQFRSLRTERVNFNPFQVLDIEKICRNPTVCEVFKIVNNRTKIYRTRTKLKSPNQYRTLTEPDSSKLK